MEPGLNGQTFTVSLDMEDFDAEALPTDPVVVNVISGVTWHYDKWHHKLLNKLSFGLLCEPYCTYRVQTRQATLPDESKLIEVNGVMLTPQEYSAFEKHFEKRWYLLPSSSCPDGFKFAINQCWPYTTYLAIASYFHTKQQ